MIHYHNLQGFSCAFALINQCVISFGLIVSGNVLKNTETKRNISTDMDRINLFEI